MQKQQATTVIIVICGILCLLHTGSSDRPLDALQSLAVSNTSSYDLNILQEFMTELNRSISLEIVRRNGSENSTHPLSRQKHSAVFDSIPTTYYEPAPRAIPTSPIATTSGSTSSRFFGRPYAPRFVNSTVISADTTSTDSSSEVNNVFLFQNSTTVEEFSGETDYPETEVSLNTTAIETEATTRSSSPQHSSTPKTSSESRTTSTTVLASTSSELTTEPDDVTDPTSSVDSLTASVRYRPISLENDTTNAVATTPTPPTEVEPPKPPEYISNSTSGCNKLSQRQLLNLLKEVGTFNPDFMAWDINGINRFVMKSKENPYDKEKDSQKSKVTLEQNFATLEKLISELDLKECNAAIDVRTRLVNATKNLKDLYASRNWQNNPSEFRLSKRSAPSADNSEDSSHSAKSDAAKTSELYRRLEDDPLYQQEKLESVMDKSKMPDNEDDMDNVGVVHVYDCQARGTLEGGYKRMCGACRAVRALPQRFFPPYINEVICDSDRACMYFYDYRKFYENKTCE